MRKYYKTRHEAIKALDAIRHTKVDIGIYRMPTGTRHHGEYAVCSYMEYLNTY